MLLKLFNWFGRNVLCCRDAARLISESCERPLSFSERFRLRMLSIMCPYTARYEKQIGLLHNRFSDCSEKVSEVLSDKSMSEDCKSRLKAKLEESA